ncbi:acyl-CoA dehydrogenase family protein [Nocardia sp. NBC_00565]|uniref:acyl-CoA dehydrogenase family protein n=1 Tax=Nocardia sp. NBC_00565 TaxID=2975993 RepID=UPI002E7FE48A|nr:acyl-CoA dehydrogenase family protein [Nocardia sp. NBC_00565]WUC05603.1 acyl-CoA dehydrogenase family protein [Nocardia sp. NBC_00565]
MQVDDFRAGVRAWIEECGADLVPAAENTDSVDAQLDHQRHVQRRLFDVGWMRWGWPQRLGGYGGSPTLRAVLGEELTSRALVHTASWSMHEVLGPAVAEFGLPEMVEEMFPRLLRGDEFWCQGFSEPEAGSDLGSLRTTAQLIGGNWVINGEKLWTSFAHHANRCVVLARTGGGGSRGISAFLVDMDTPGVTASPLRTMANVDEFCSMSFVDVKVPAHRLLGGVGAGWRVAQHILSCERGTIFWQRGAWLGHHLGLLLEVPTAMQSHRALGEAFQLLWAFRATSKATQERIAQGDLPGPEASVDKIMIAAAEQAVFDTARELLRGDLEIADTPAARTWRREWAYSRAASIYGGTSEIQKDIVASRLLGLPRSA